MKIPNSILWALGGAVIGAGFCTAVKADAYQDHFALLLAYEHHQAGEFNEDNYGLGWRWLDRQSRNSHTVMVYENSEFRTSFAYEYNWNWWGNKVVRIGGSLAIASGYDVPAFAPFITIQIGPLDTRHLPGVVSAFGLVFPAQD